MTDQKLNEKALQKTREAMPVDTIRDMINAGTFKMNVFAKENKLQTKMVRQVLTEYFGSTLVFRRGRYGGIGFVKESE
jgi:hypothetical protein